MGQFFCGFFCTLMIIQSGAVCKEKQAGGKPYENVRQKSPGSKVRVAEWFMRKHGQGNLFAGGVTETAGCGIMRLVYKPRRRWKGMRAKIGRQWIRIVLGLLVFAFGVHLTIYANIGLAPWDCLGMGIAKHTPLNYGLSMTAMALVILGIDLLLKERIGFGTIIDAVLTGNFVQMFNDLNPLEENRNTWIGILIMLAGFVFMALGMWIYMKGEQCCGPRDSLLVGIGKRLPKVPIGIVEILLWAAVLLAGWLLGGPVGIGTLISTFGAGLVMQVVYNLIRFEPRKVRHRAVAETVRILLSGKTEGEQTI